MKKKYLAIIGALVILVIILTIAFFKIIDPIKRFAPMDETRLVSDMSDFDKNLLNMEQAVISLDLGNDNGEDGEYIFTEQLNMKKVSDTIGLMEIQYTSLQINEGNSDKSISISMAYNTSHICVSFYLIENIWYVSFTGIDDWKGYEDAEYSYYKLKGDAEDIFTSLLADICKEMTLDDVMELSQINGLKLENFSTYNVAKCNKKLPESIRGQLFYYPVEAGYGVAIDYYYSQSYSGSTIVHGSQIVSAWLININGEAVSIKGNLEQIQEFINK